MHWGLAVALIATLVALVLALVGAFQQGEGWAWGAAAASLIALGGLSFAARDL